jgi:hypothetical protein
MSITILHDRLQACFFYSMFLKGAVEQYRLREKGGINGVKYEVSKTMAVNFAPVQLHPLVGMLVVTKDKFGSRLDSCPTYPALVRCYAICSPLGHPPVAGDDYKFCVLFGLFDIQFHGCQIFLCHMGRKEIRGQSYWKGQAGMISRTNFSNSSSVKYPLCFFAISSLFSVTCLSTSATKACRIFFMS